MPKLIYLLKIFLSLYIVLLISACTSTRLTSVWRDESRPMDAIKTVMVKGVASSPRDSRLLEDAFVRQFSANGVEALGGSSPPSIAKPETPPQKNPTQLIAQAQKKQMDALLVVKLAGVVKKKIYHPPRPYFSSLGYSDLHLRPYHHFPPYFYEPGYYTEHPFYQIESNLYDVSTSQLIWSAASETFDPGSVNALVESASQTIIQNLRTSKLFSE